MTKLQAKQNLRTLTEKMKKEFLEQNKPLVEAGVREEFLSPLIKQVWGYATADIDYEYYVKSANDYVDYRINPTDEISFFTDAKRLNEELNKHAAKIAQYLAVDNARWGVLCNGCVLQVYDDDVKVKGTATPIEKKVLEISLVDYQNDDEFDHVFEQVWLLSKESMTHNWLDEYVDSVLLTKHLQQVLQQPHELIIKAARQAVKKVCDKDFKPQVVASALKRVINSFSNSTSPLVSTSTSLPVTVSGASQKKGKKRADHNVHVSDLLSAKLLQPGQKIYAKHNGFNYEATVEADGSITFKGESYSSLSTAGIAACQDSYTKLEVEQTASVNGWVFWHYQDANGKRKPLSDLRAKLKTQ